MHEEMPVPLKECLMPASATLRRNTYYVMLTGFSPYRPMGDCHRFGAGKAVEGLLRGVKMLLVPPLSFFCAH